MALSKAFSIRLSVTKVFVATSSVLAITLVVRSRPRGAGSNLVAKADCCVGTIMLLQLRRLWLPCIYLAAVGYTLLLRKKPTL